MKPFVFPSFLILIGAALLTAYAIAGISAASQARQTPSAATYGAPDAAEQLVNEQRQANGLKPLMSNDKLDDSACAKASDIKSRGYWSHVSPDGTTPWQVIKGSGYEYEEAGENLARDFSSDAAMVQGWMDSPTHRANILDPDFTEQGMCRVGNVVVNHFGSPRS